ncbi:hypothetical protein [Clostridium lundense]|uniref:hypothetical protein n=1 Tax=Clostridium lundense TaxID=319475 RepID=UPI000488273D|nr:hypothetical protein [Clostridium lundense]
MRNIVVFDNNREFKTYLKNQLELINIECVINECPKKFYGSCDYVIVNNGEYLDGYKENLSGKYLLINMDMLGDSIINFNGNVVTYGLGNRNTVTVSSMEKGNGSFVYCLQRALAGNNLLVIQPEEIPIKTYFKDNYELYSFMVTITIALIEGINSDSIRKYFNLRINNLPK